VLARKAIALESKLMNRKNVSHTPQIVRKGTRNYLFDRTNIVFRDEGPKTSRLWKFGKFQRHSSENNHINYQLNLQLARAEFKILVSWNSRFARFEFNLAAP
jgi:hypothetical protein